MKTKIQKILLLLIALTFAAADTQAGRWLSRDPIQEGAGFVQRDPLPGVDLNLYGFVGNNPISFIDMLGLETVTDDIWVKSGYTAMRILGPAGSKCCKVPVGEAKVDFAYIKALLGESMNENHQNVMDYITSKNKTSGKAQANIQAASYLGAGFGITFTPSAGAGGCCTKNYWQQRFIRDGQYYVPGIVTYLGGGVGGIDFTTSGATAVDFPGDTISGYFNRNFGRSFLLTLFCDKQPMFSFVWDYRVSYDKMKNSATVTLNIPF